VLGSLTHESMPPFKKARSNPANKEAPEAISPKSTGCMVEKSHRNHEVPEMKTAVFESRLKAPSNCFEKGGGRLAKVSPPPDGHPEVSGRVLQVCGQGHHVSVSQADVVDSKGTHGASKPAKELGVCLAQRQRSGPGGRGLACQASVDPDGKGTLRGPAEHHHRHVVRIEGCPGKSGPVPTAAVVEVDHTIQPGHAAAEPVAVAVNLFEGARVRCRLVVGATCQGDRVFPAAVAQAKGVAGWADSHLPVDVHAVEAAVGEAGRRLPHKVPVVSADVPLDPPDRVGVRHAGVQVTLQRPLWRHAAGW
jgi:hypothetical protein